MIYYLLCIRDELADGTPTNLVSIPIQGIGLIEMGLSKNSLRPSQYILNAKIEYISNLGSVEQFLMTYENESLEEVMKQYQLMLDIQEAINTDSTSPLLKEPVHLYRRTIWIKRYEKNR